MKTVNTPEFVAYQ
jgi:glycine hydroxymethyltransferase